MWRTHVPERQELTAGNRHSSGTERHTIGGGERRDGAKEEEEVEERTSKRASDSRVFVWLSEAQQK
jgi:hypothetical protein